MRAAPLLLSLGVLAGAAPARDPLIEQAIEQLMRDDGDSGLAERILRGLPDRALVIESAERALAGEGSGVRGKRRLLWLLLFDLKRADLVAKAIGSRSLSTQRAAAFLLADQEAGKPILLAWIAEESPPDLPLLVQACRKARLAGAAEWLVKVAEAKDTPPAVFADAVAALAAHPSEAFVGLLKRRLADPDEDPVRVEACIDALAKLAEVDADEVLIPWLKQQAHRTVRMKANLAIRDPAVHRQVVLDPDETDAILQRQALYRLMERLDDAALLELLRNPRVNRHRYFAVRVDVCTALACVEGAGAPDLPVLLDYLVDGDPQDRDRDVRSEAWITLWTLTGEMHGTEGDFAKPPRRAARRYRTYRIRPGITDEQRKELETLAQDLDHMRAVREAYAAAK